MCAGAIILFDWTIVPNPEAELSLRLFVLDVYDSWPRRKQLPDHHADLSWEIVESRDGSSCDLGIGMDGFVRVCRHDDQQSEGLRLATK
jgi:hypothetical protein